MQLEHWHALMQRWGTPRSDAVHADLVAAYSEPHRRYHDVRHIEDCLRQFDAAAALAASPEEVELALWFHDAVYKTSSARNEERSAEWAASFLRSSGVAHERCERVRELVLATRHTPGALSGDAALLVDIDLSILGRAPEEYAAFENAIREEYGWVPGPIFRAKRAAILQSFLDRPAIYGTPHFAARFEQAARVNLRWAIERLKGGSA
jgi:predicted metal-dependent HD superfamily phosphohydrolase